MELPFAVHTAREGYGWVSGQEAGVARLAELRNAVGKSPELDVESKGVRGAVNAGDAVVVYCFMREVKADFRGRDAVYLALTYFNRAESGKIDIGHILGLDIFNETMREPPSTFVYAGGDSADSEYDPECKEACGTRRIELACAGSVFQKPFKGKLHVRCEEDAGGRRIGLALHTPPEIPQSEVTQMSPVPEIRNPTRCTPSAGVAVPVNQRRIIIMAGLAASIVLALGVGIVWPGVILWRQRTEKLGELRKEDTIEVKELSVTSRDLRTFSIQWLFDEAGRWTRSADWSYTFRTREESKESSDAGFMNFKASPEQKRRTVID